MGVRLFDSKKHRQRVWGYEALIGGQKKRKTGFSSKQAAEIALSKARINANERAAGVTIERPATVKVSQIIERRKAQLGGTCRRRATQRNLDRFSDTLPASLSAHELKTAHLQAYVDLRLRSVKPQTVFRELTDVCAMLNCARDSFAQLEDWTPPRRPRLKIPTGARNRLIAPTEAARLLAFLRAPRRDGESQRFVSARCDSADLFQIALLTAARRMEILSLRWSDVNFTGGSLRIVGTKTDQVRNIPMTAGLVRLLGRRQLACGADSPLVFPALAGKTMLRYNTDQIYRRASRSLSIPYGRDVAGGWVLHDARHTAITAMLHAGNSLESVMAVSGHNARVMALRYAHSTEQTRRAAVSALEQFAAEKSSAFSSTGAAQTL